VSASSTDFERAELSDSWIEGDDTARWRTASGHAGASSGSSLLEVAPGFRLPRHTDSAEETIVVVAGKARVTVAEQSEEVGAGGLALVPADVPHEVESTGSEPLRFLAVYAAAEVTTTYEEPVQPDGERSREPF
jgi:quercetin dioxygenase-like cupin family protein